MPTLHRDDGIELHYERHGEGPVVLLAPYWSGHPSAFANLERELAGDHTVVRFDARGTGQSTRRGPFDMETGAADLAAVAEAVGGDAILIGIGDAVNRIVRVAASDPELVHAAVCPGAPPVPRSAFEGTDALIASDNVIEAFMEMLSSSYRGALQALLPQTNEQMSDEEVQKRIDLQAEYVPQETAIAMVKAWIDDDATEAARETGDRLWVLYSENIAGPWMPNVRKMLPRYRELFPEAHLVEIEDGIVSRPDLTGDVIRELTAGIQSSA